MIVIPLPGKPLVLLLFLFVLPAMVFLQAAEPPQTPLPVIPRLDSRDTVFRQYLADVEAARRLLFSTRQSGHPDPGKTGQIAASITIYSYLLREEDELLGVAARCNIPYATLATINRFSHTEDLQGGKILLIPSVPGIFIPEAPQSDLERLLGSARAATESDQTDGFVLSIPREGKTERFRFLPGDDFSPTERIFFLNRGFHFPLRNFEVSSFYGPRKNPVTGKFGVHQGLDLAAPEGSDVYAVRNGTVADVGEDPVLGKYIILSHDNSWASIYGHLSSIITSLHAEVQSGNLIARVGTTGQSTGPHLHFEIRQNGQSRDPARLFGITKGNSR